MALLISQPESTTVDATQFVKLSLANKTAPASTTAAVIRLRLEATGASPSGTVYFDGVLVVLSSSIPTLWVSSRNVFNNLDDDDQAGVNYVDIHDALGDQPAKLQLKATENENHTKLWVGARHGSDRQYDSGINHEGEDFATWTAELADATYASDGNYGQNTFGVTYDAAASDEGASVSSLTFSHTLTTNGLRCLFVAVCVEDATNQTPTGVTYNAISMTQIGSTVISSGPHHQDSGEAKIRESTAGVSRKPSSDCKACGCSSKHLCGLTAWNT